MPVRERGRCGSLGSLLRHSANPKFVLSPLLSLRLEQCGGSGACAPCLMGNSPPSRLHLRVIDERSLLSLLGLVLEVPGEVLHALRTTSLR
eukprot:14403098-Heterocapsa_arctica.AAC.1